MKKRIIIGLTVFAAIFFFGGVYIISTIERATDTLDTLITLHQIELQREQLLIDAKRVQSDLAFEHTRYARKLDTVVANVIRMDREADRCLGCHHVEATTQSLIDTKKQIQSYKDALSRVLTMRANASRLQAEEDRAFQVGQAVVDKLSSMTVMTRIQLEKRTRFSLKEIAHMKILLFLLISLGPVLAIGLASVFIKGFTTPLNVLLGACRRLKGGDLMYRVQGLTDEFGEMATSFNEMADSLNEQMRKMQRAEQMTMVGQMAAGLVHEIKNPLSGIKGSMQLLLDEVNLPGEGRTILSKTMDEVQRIEALMKSLLNFAKPSQPLFMKVNMNDILESTLTLLSSYAVMKLDAPEAVRIVRHFDPLLSEAMADPVQMQQVFLNLFLNAVDAMPAGGTLEVSTAVDRATGGIRIDIADTGQGIGAAVREKIFEPFFTTKRKGTGLGLAISKQFIEMHGGTIIAEKNTAAGTIFRISLPALPEETVIPPDHLSPTTASPP